MLQVAYARPNFIDFIDKIYYAISLFYLDKNQSLVISFISFFPLILFFGSGTYRHFISVSIGVFSVSCWISFGCLLRLVTNHPITIFAGLWITCRPRIMLSSR